jgi:hypothetical protein
MLIFASLQISPSEETDDVRKVNEQGGSRIVVEGGQLLMDYVRRLMRPQRLTSPSGAGYTLPTLAQVAPRALHVRILLIVACCFGFPLISCTSPRAGQAPNVATPPTPVATAPVREVRPRSLPSFCGTPDPNVDFYTVIQTNTAVPPHAVFCGNYAKSPIPAEVQAGKRPPMTPPGDSPTGLPFQKRCGPGEAAPAGSYAQGCCVGHAYDSDCSVAPNTCRVPATEKVEIRGNVVGFEAYTDTSHGAHNQEYNFDVLLDLNWDRDPCLPDGVTTINSLEASRMP